MTARQEISIKAEQRKTWFANWAGGLSAARVRPLILARARIEHVASSPEGLDNAWLTRLRFDLASQPGYPYPKERRIVQIARTPYATEQVIGGHDSAGVVRELHQQQPFQPRQLG